MADQHVKARMEEGGTTRYFILRVYQNPASPPLILADCGTGSAASNVADQIVAAFSASGS